MYTALQNSQIQVNLIAQAQTTGWTIDGTTATHEIANPGSIVLSNYPIVAGQTYLFSYYIPTITGGYVQASLGGVQGVQRTIAGYYTESITATSTASLQFYSTASCALTAFNIKNNTANPSLKPQNTIVWSEKNKKWTSFYTIVPDCGFWLFTKGITYHNGNAYLHQSGSLSRNNLYGTQYNSFVNFVVNNNPTQVKRFLSINYQSNQLLVTSPSGITTSLGHISELDAPDFLLETLNDGVTAIQVYDREGVYSACFLRDMNEDIINGTPLSGNYMTIELQTTNPSTVLKLFTVEIQTSNYKIGTR